MANDLEKYLSPEDRIWLLEHEWKPEIPDVPVGYPFSLQKISFAIDMTGAALSSAILDITPIELTDGAWYSYSAGVIVFSLAAGWIIKKFRIGRRKVEVRHREQLMDQAQMLREIELTKARKEIEDKTRTQQRELEQHQREVRQAKEREEQKRRDEEQKRKDEERLALIKNEEEKARTRAEMELERAKEHCRNEDKKFMLEQVRTASTKEYEEWFEAFIKEGGVPDRREPGEPSGYYIPKYTYLRIKALYSEDAMRIIIPEDCHYVFDSSARLGDSALYFMSYGPAKAHTVFVWARPQDVVHYTG